MTRNPKKKEKQQYYGSQEKESLTYLEFGGIDLVEGTKSIWDFRIDQEAYDFLMLSRYAKEIIAFNKKNFIISMLQNLEEKYFVYQDNNIIAVVPPFARYAYEIWIMPKKQKAGPWEFNEDEINSFAECLQKVVKGYDLFLQKKCPYIMGLHAAPKLEDDKFHFHIEFYPPLRSGDKPKILAGSESMAGVFIMDVLPEDSAKILRKYINK